MKTDKSRSQLLKFNSTSETVQKENTLQRDAVKKYLKFKKSASQPAYFLNKSRLKKISDIYRAVSLQKLARNQSLHKSKSLHNSITPEKKSSFYNNGTFKKSSGLNTLNLNKALQNNQKTKRLRLDRTQQVQNSSVQSIAQNGAKFFLHQIQRLEQISQMTIQKAFTGQYEYFFKSLKQECFGRKGPSSDIKSLVTKFCYLMQICQQRQAKISEKQLKSKYDKVELNFSNTHTELKKKSFKMELLIKEINQLKDHNMKISRQLSQARQNKTLCQKFGKSQNEKRHLQINNIIELRIQKSHAQITTPIYQQKFTVLRDNTQNFGKKYQQKQLSGKNQNTCQKNDGLDIKMHANQRLEMVKKIRNLQKKQKQLVQTLLVLKSDGINVQKAYQQVLSGQQQQLQADLNSLNLQKERIPSYIRKIKNTDSYEADGSIIDSIQGLTVRYFDGQPEEEYVMYPIRHEYKSKPLPAELQKKLNLDFNVLYQDCEYMDGSENQQFQHQNPPTI